MRIEKYLGSIVPNFERSRITEELRTPQEEISKKTLPAYDSAVEIFDKGYKFKSREIKGLNDRAVRRLDRREPNLYIATEKALKKIEKHISKLIDFVEKEFESEISSSALSYLQEVVTR